MVKSPVYGVFLDLTPYIEKYAPDYYALRKSNPDIMRGATTVDNKFAAFKEVKPVSDPALMRLMIRDDIMRESGITQLPVTIDEFTAVFKAFKERKGKAGYTMVENGRERYIMGAYGIFNIFYKDGNTVKFGPSEARYRDYLTKIAEWYRLGYINPGFPSLRQPQRDSLFQQGETMVVNSGLDNYMIWAKDLGIGTMPTKYQRLKMGDKLHVHDWEVFPIKNEGNTAISAMTNTKKRGRTAQ